MKKIMAIILCMFLLTSVCFGNEVVEKAKKYMPMVAKTLDDLWPTMPRKEIIPAQIGRESGFNPHATLKTSRELGRGFGQITITYTAAHKERFNNFRNAVTMKGLKGWNWKKDPYNVQYQLMYLILSDKSNYNTARPFMINDDEAVKTMLVSYNAGDGRWIIRRTYAKAMGIPTDRWTGGLDRACKPSEKKTKVYGESLCQMVNDYPEIVFKQAPDYTQFFEETK
jgi:hypothetical protein